MADGDFRSQTPPPSLTQHAFLEPLHLGALVLAVLLSLVLPLPPLFEFGGLIVAELAYLFGFARTPAYARRVNLKLGQRLLEDREQAIEQRATALRMDDRRRFSAIQKSYQALIQKLDEPALANALPPGLDRDRLLALREAALEFSLTSQKFREHLSKADLNQLAKTLQQPVGSSEAERTSRDLQKQRYDGLIRMQTQLKSLDAQLEVIEQTFALLKEQLSTLSVGAAMAGTDAGSTLTANVNSLTRDVEATRRTLAELGAMEQAGRF